MITVRVVRTEAEIDEYVAVRTRIHPETPMPREVVENDRRDPTHLDLLAEVGGEVVGAASAGTFGGAPDGELAFLTIRVVAEHRRRGVGTALHLRCSEHARSLGKERFWVAARHVDEDSLGYYGARGYEEVGRMQDVVLELAGSGVRPSTPDGVEIVPLAEEHDRGVYEVAGEAEPDIPTGTAMVRADYERWHERNFAPGIRRDLSFVALDGGRVVGYATLGRFTDDTCQHWMTGVARSARGRGIALALKEAQIAAAKAAGVGFLRTQNDLGNAPMRRVNEKLGYERRFEWVHLSGPLLAG